MNSTFRTGVSIASVLKMRFTTFNLRSLAELKPETMAVMHGSSYRGACDGPLIGLAGVIKETFEQR